MLAGLKKCDMPHNVLRTRGSFRDGVNAERRGVGGQDRSPFAGSWVERGEDFLLQLHILEHGLDHQIGVRQRIDRFRWLHQCNAALRPSALMRALCVAPIGAAQLARLA